MGAGVRRSSAGGRRPSRPAGGMAGQGARGARTEEATRSVGGRAGLVARDTAGKDDGAGRYGRAGCISPDAGPISALWLCLVCDGRGRGVMGGGFWGRVAGSAATAGGGYPGAGCVAGCVRGCGARRGAAGGGDVWYGGGRGRRDDGETALSERRSGGAAERLCRGDGAADWRCTDPSMRSLTGPGVAEEGRRATRERTRIGGAACTAKSRKAVWLCCPPLRQSSQ